MAVAITFDTLQFVKTLVKAEVPQKQAEAYAKAFKEANDNSADGLATKQDLFVTKQELKSEIQELKSEMKEVKSEIKEVRQEIDLKCSQLKVDLIKWMVTLAMGQAAVIVSLIKLLR